MQPAANGSTDITDIVEKWKGKQGNLIMILHEIQNRYSYVPRDISFKLSELLDVPMARIYEVLTFYNYFKLQPPGRNIISVCMGTACYLKGAPAILEELEHALGISEGETTRDGQFHLEVVRCLGCCGLAPVMKIGGKVYGGLKKKDVMDILSEYSKEDAPAPAK
jgi:NADH-quinone oxidoreductase subunit E